MRMKKLVLAGAVAGLTFSSSVMSADTTIVYGTYGAASSTLVREGVIPFLEEAKRLSGGSLDYELHPGGALVGATTTLTGVRDGIVDGGVILNIYHQAEVPVSNTTSNLSALTSDPRVVAAAVNEVNLLKCPECLAEWEEWNIKYLGGYSTAAYNLLCREPVATMEDLRGKRIRAPGDWGRMADAIGMVPVNMSIGETYEGLQRGQLDCTFGAIGWLDSFSFGEVTPNVLRINTGTTFNGPLLDVRLDKWNTLTDDQKQALVDAAVVGVAGSAYGYLADDQKVLNQVEEMGYNVVEPSDSLMRTIQEFAESEIERVIEQSEGRGVENAERIVADFREALEKWRGIVGEVGDDREAYEAALRREIFDHYPL